jgi:hypothetical protein
MVSPKPHCQISDKIKYNKKQDLKQKNKKKKTKNKKKKLGRTQQYESR